VRYGHDARTSLRDRFDETHPRVAHLARGSSHWRAWIDVAVFATLPSIGPWSLREADSSSSGFGNAYLSKWR
jgi:hypothetical protein